MRRGHWLWGAAVLAAGLSGGAWAWGWHIPANCSAYQGRVVVNEYNFLDNFVELKILDGAAQDHSDDFDDWHLRVYTRNRTTSKSVKDAVERRSCGSSSGTYLRFNFATNEMGQDAVVRLSDSHGRDVDVFWLGQNGLPGYYDSPCSGFPFDTDLLLGSSGTKDVARQPDGTGDWTLSPGTGAGSQKTPCSSNDGSSAAVPSAFNAVDVGASPMSGQITTKVAGAPFSLDVHALAAGGVDTAFTGAVLVDLLANAATGVAMGADNCPVTATSLAVGSVTLTAGSATVAMGEVADSWRDVRVRVRYPATGTATVTGCSADNFAVKPAALSAIASHADWQSAGTAATLANSDPDGGVIHKAGRPFSLRVTGYNADGAVTGNYDGSPQAATTCILPASGCVPGSLAVGSYGAGAGTVTSTTASYSEVGAVSVSLVDSVYGAVDADDTAASCAGYHACAAAISIGRFVPDHFDLAANAAAFAPGCGSFTYIGQPFGFGTAPAWTLTARNAAGATTQNYTGSLWKLPGNGSTVSGQAWTASTGTVTPVAALPAPAVTALGAGVGRIDFAVGDPAGGGGLRFSRAAPVAPFSASLTLAASVADSEGVLHPGNPFQHAGIGFTGASDQQRYGRLRLVNALGSELLALPVPLTSQYWDGQGFVHNGDDYCTLVPALAPVAQTTPLTPGLTFHADSAQNRLAAGETAATLSAPLVAGNANLRLSAPGAGNHGYLDLAADAPAWLDYNWDGVDQGGDGNLHDDNPRARAAFGKRRGSDAVIIRREIY
jgi:MSHA biogenesis protein MshQ